MKKIFLVLITLTLAASLTVTAFAADTAENSKNTEISEPITDTDVATDAENENVDADNEEQPPDNILGETDGDTDTTEDETAPPEDEGESSIPDEITPPDTETPDDSNGSDVGITLDDVSALIKDALAEAGISEKILDWRSYVEKQLIPAAVTAISAIAALYVACIPLIKNIKNSIQNVVENVKSGVGLFKKAADDVSSAAEEKQKTETELATLKEDLAYIKSHIKTVEEIERIGFGNLKELVTGGIASEIGKVGHEDENQT